MFLATEEGNWLPTALIYTRSGSTNGVVKSRPDFPERDFWGIWEIPLVRLAR
jgi:hypothetical protein